MVAFWDVNGLKDLIEKLQLLLKDNGYPDDPVRLEILSDDHPYLQGNVNSVYREGDCIWIQAEFD